MSDRTRFQTRSIRLVSRMQVDTVRALVENVPIDAHDPIEVVFREVQKTRTPDANARMWAGPLKDIAEQAWLRGRQYSIDVWHEHFKREFLPDPDVMRASELELRVKEGYRKWEEGPGGFRECVGSTTMLTPFGFREYLEQVEAMGAGLGVHFSVSPRERETA